MSRTPNNNIQISVQCHPNVIAKVRSYARNESIQEQKRIDNEELSKQNKNV